MGAAAGMHRVHVSPSERYSRSVASLKSLAECSAASGDTKRPEGYRLLYAVVTLSHVTPVTVPYGLWMYTIDAKRCLLGGALSVRFIYIHTEITVLLSRSPLQQEYGHNTHTQHTPYTYTTCRRYRQSSHLDVQSGRREHFCIHDESVTVPGSGGGRECCSWGTTRLEWGAGFAVFGTRARSRVDSKSTYHIGYIVFESILYKFNFVSP